MKCKQCKQCKQCKGKGFYEAGPIMHTERSKVRCTQCHGKGKI